MKLKNKRIVLTGASSGIGRELLQQLLDEECTVVAASRSIEKLEISHERLFLKACDVSNPDDIDDLFKYATKKMGQIDIFIANAGFAYYGELSESDWQHIERIFKTNNIGLIYAAEKMKAYFNDQPYQFVCTASGMSFWSIPGYSLYSASKAAIRGFADAYRHELGKDQLFQIVYPITTRTKFFENAGDSPVPWPSQSAEYVAKTIIRGIKWKQESIYPSKLFQSMLILNRIFPFIRYLYIDIQNRQFKKWLAAQAHKEG